jgi:hypothetical protein
MICIGWLDMRFLWCQEKKYHLFNAQFDEIKYDFIDLKQLKL